ncbi:hypothetical protein CK203_038731 [Vitis vinifera]|uniref:Uncharacterized protein n=1 Tax=Vitis vinifera TaxID=29760 RepID=A0A438HV06_VITVI|nr:hypothetical protein CK203_038731 [Vitis vinifera]
MAKHAISLWKLNTKLGGNKEAEYGLDQSWSKEVRKCKEIERKKSERNRAKRTKNRVKTSKNRGLRDFAASAKLALRCETISQLKRSRCEINMSLRKRPSFAKSFRNSFDSSAKIFAAAKPSLAHECHFAEQEPPFRSCELAAKLQSVKIPIFAVKAPFRRVFRSCETKFGTRVPFRSTVTSISKLRNGLRSGLQERFCCEIDVLLRNSK